MNIRFTAVRLAWHNTRCFALDQALSVTLRMPEGVLQHTLFAFHRFQCPTHVSGVVVSVDCKSASDGKPFRSALRRPARY